MKFKGFNNFHFFMMTKGLDSLSAADYSQIFAVYDLIAANFLIYCAIGSLGLEEENMLPPKMTVENAVERAQDVAVLEFTEKGIKLDKTTVYWDGPYLGLANAKIVIASSIKEIKPSKTVKEIVKFKAFLANKETTERMLDLIRPYLKDYDKKAIKFYNSQLRKLESRIADKAEQKGANLEYFSNNMRNQYEWIIEGTNMVGESVRISIDMLLGKIEIEKEGEPAEIPETTAQELATKVTFDNYLSALLVTQRI